MTLNLKVFGFRDFSWTIEGKFVNLTFFRQVLKWLRIKSWLKIKLAGFFPWKISMAYANAKRPQSSLPFCVDSLDATALPIKYNWHIFNNICTLYFKTIIIESVRNRDALCNIDRTSVINRFGIFLGQNILNSINSYVLTRP